MILTLDFETRSPVNIHKRGHYVYNEHPDTSTMCVAVMIDDGQPMLFIPIKYLSDDIIRKVPYDIISDKVVINLIQKADKIVAHNAMFEYTHWNGICVRDFGWPELPLEKLVDTMAMTAYHGLPLALDKAALALNLDIQKDMYGQSIMQKLSKPRKPKKDENPNGLYWNEEPEDLIKLFNYGASDVKVEKAIYNTLPELPEIEQKIRMMTEEINSRGVPVDMGNVKKIVEVIESQEEKQLKRFQILTKGEVTGPRSYPALRKWVNKEAGLELEDINKETTKWVIKTLKEEVISDLKIDRRNLNRIIETRQNVTSNEISTLQEIYEKIDKLEAVIEVLKIKQELSKSSTAKLQAMINRSTKDNRFKGGATYHGAGPGRWAARGVQFQNLPRDSHKPQEWEACMRMFERGDIEGLEMFYPSIYHAASRCVRGAFKAPEGKRFISADYNAVEGRGLAYLAGEEWVLDAYRENKDLYKVFASKALNKPYEEITKEERNNPGKIGELACGYGGSVGAVRKFGGGEGMTDEDILQKIVYPWRNSHPKTAAFWYAVEKAAMSAVQNPGKLYTVGVIRYRVHKNFLKCYMPAGRVMHYYLPKIQAVKMPWTNKENQDVWKEAITYMGVKIVDGKTTAQWARIPTRGAKLVENIVQGFCRDLLAWGMLRLSDQGYDGLCFHVHDECTAEIGDLSPPSVINHYCETLEQVPFWAEGMPIKAEGWIGRRYRK